MKYVKYLIKMRRVQQGPSSNSELVYYLFKKLKLSDMLEYLSLRKIVTFEGMLEYFHNIF